MSWLPYLDSLLQAPLLWGEMADHFGLGNPFSTIPDELVAALSLVVEGEASKICHIFSQL